MTKLNAIETAILMSTKNWYLKDYHGLKYKCDNFIYEENSVLDGCDSLVYTYTKLFLIDRSNIELKNLNNMMMRVIEQIDSNIVYKIIENMQTGNYNCYTISQALFIELYLELQNVQIYDYTPDGVKNSLINLDSSLMEV